MPGPDIAIPGALRSMRWALLLTLVTACTPGGCPFASTPDGGPTTQCRLDRDCADNEKCENGACVSRFVCETDEDCGPLEHCNQLTGECDRDVASECGPLGEGRTCAPGQFCSLGKCRDIASATICSRRFQCPVGQVCDRVSFYCIEELDCRLAAGSDETPPLPELECDPGDTCDPNNGVCVTGGDPECEPTATPTGCANGLLCNGARQCVQCISNAHCGPGLRCNTRAGLCESENTCRRDTDCTPPLVCDRVTALCSVPLPPCESDFQCQLGQFCDRTLGTCQPREGKCDDDRLEDADTPPAARPVDLTNATATLTDLQLCPNDPDVYAAQLTPGDQLTVRLLDTAASARAEMTVLGPDGLQTIRYVEAPPRGNGTVSFIAQLAGYYYVRVISPTGKTAYRLEFVREPAEVCEQDLTEPDDNNPWGARLFNVTQNEALQGSLCPGDGDWFRIQPRLLAGEAVSVELEGPDQEDLDLQLTTDDGLTVYATSEGPGSQEFVRYRVDEAQTLLVHVTPYGPSSGIYALRVTIHPAYVCTPDVLETTSSGNDGGVADAGASDASVEDAGASDASTADAGPTAPGNDSREVATPVGLAGLERDLSICAGDEDWFVVEARAHQRVLATATWSYGESGVLVDGYAPDGSLLGHASGATLAPLSVPGNAEGKVYVRVSRPGSSSAYHLDITVERLVDCVTDSAEPNNTPVLATAAPEEGLFTICGSDNDLFRLPGLGAGRRVMVDAEFSTADGDIDLALLLPDGVTVLAISDGVGPTEALDVILPADPPDGGHGTYFLQVFSARSDTAARYLLRVQTPSP
ncbi:MAG: hypothetical protein AB2A00_08660 [Myxococcota bacterium]